MMKKLFFLLSIMAVVTACSAPRVVARTDFDAVPVGENTTSLLSRLGTPYQIREVNAHSQEYVYIERVSLSSEKELYRFYIFVVEDGNVVSKKVEEATGSSFHFSME